MAGNPSILATTPSFCTLEAPSTVRQRPLLAHLVKTQLLSLRSTVLFFRHCLRQLPQKGRHHQLQQPQPWHSDQPASSSNGQSSFTHSHMLRPSSGSLTGWTRQAEQHLSILWADPREMLMRKECVFPMTSSHRNLKSVWPFPPSSYLSQPAQKQRRPKANAGPFQPSVSCLSVGGERGLVIITKAER